MVESDIDEIFAGMIEWGKFLPSDKKFPIEIVVLRGHLLIERELRRLIQIKFTRQSAYNLDRSRFSNLMRLTESLYGDAVPDWVWEGLKQLNALRNSLAHNLVDEIIPKRVEKIIDDFKKRDPSISPYFKEYDISQIDQLSLWISYIQLELLKAR